MSETVKDYLSTPPSARLDSPNSVHAWLTALDSQALTAYGSLSDSLRTKFCRALISDLTNATGARQAPIPSNSRARGKWSPELRLLSLKVLKELSRLPGGSSPLAERQGLESLLLQIDFPPAKRSAARKGRKSGSSGNSSPPPALSSSPSFAGTLSRALRRPKTPSSGSRGSDTSPRLFSTAKPSHADSDESATIDEEPAPSTSPNDGAPDWQITDMALRCLNNALFLHEASRLELSSEGVAGGQTAVALLANPSETPVDVLFLGSRLLFFGTLFESPLNRTAVESFGVVRKEADCVRTLLRTIRESENGEAAPSRQSTLVASATGTQLATALSDLLKAHFNLCLYYPRLASSSSGRSSSGAQSNDNVDRGDDISASNSAGNGTASNGNGKSEALQDRAVAGESYHEALDDMLDPVLEVVASLPLSEPVPLIPPMTHAIAALLNYPLKGYHERWASRSLDQHGLGLSELGNDSDSRNASPTGSPTGSTARKLADSVSALFSSSSSSSANRRGSKSAASTSAPADHGQTASSPPSPRAARQTTAFSREISRASTAALETAPPVLSRLLVIADRVLDRYLSAAAADDGPTQNGSHSVEDPDSKQVRAAANRDGVEIEDTVPPLLLLLRKIAADDGTFRHSMRSILLPSDLDRSRPLDKRLDLLGRLVRLMSSVMLQRTARAAGEMLLAICESDPKSMTEAIGYGPCAGFLMNSGLASALPPSYTNGNGSSPDGSGRTVNPITGQFDPTAEELAADMDSMTEEEKEAEAEKLFCLFDRLNRTGVVKVQDPREKLHEEGRFEEIDGAREDEERRRMEEEDENDERIVEREMRERKKRMEEARRRARKLAGKAPEADEGERGERIGDEAPAPVAKT
ncbi:uncharacterized protein PFL1_06747 [Pseudozyma flocculosa PF-1]|uniref:Synembryn-A n=2 Tax=Pseudozyma flocculosa TaxID=84751 RepID=A0A5C3FAI3_9BASI|nr:uncharacterized protein PFL1_06747 [Pseudozyma flocculosa PF-1]EPQ25675.1 hypothetical protein PFL1_06747 [Pseudozyma flocculosa PF-1]SPO40451.1 uncharacterized protein PSFLO_05933 [Pseudozyma flocculosa]